MSPIIAPPYSGTSHRFVSAVADGVDATVVRPSNWNDGHRLYWGMIEEDFGTIQTYFGSWTVTDPSILLTSHIAVSLSGEAPTGLRDGIGADGDEAEMESMILTPQNIAVGSFLLTAEVVDGPVTGPYKFIYQVG